MADSRVTTAAIITDPTTGTQQAGVDASGFLQCDLAASSVSQTVTNAGTFAVQVDGTALTALQLIDDTVAVLGTATYAEATTKGNVIAAVRNNTLAALADTDNELAPLQVNASGALYIQEGAALDVSGATVTVTGTVTANLSATDNTVLDNIDTDTSNIDTNTTDIPNVIGTDGSAGPTKAISIGGTDGSGNLQECLTDTDGHLQVDVLSGGSEVTPTNPATDITNVTTPVNVAAGANGDATSADLPSKYLCGVTIGGALPFKAIIGTLTNGSRTNIAVLFGDGGTPVSWSPPHRNFAQAGSSAGADGFEVNITNLDPADTTDYYVSFFYADD